MGLIAAGIGAAVIGGIAQGAAANSASKSAKHATDVNAQLTRETNEQNYKQWLQSRGGTGEDGYGHAILGNYFGQGEQQAGNDAFQSYQRLMSGANNLYGQTTGYQQQLAPSLASNLQAIGNFYNGEDLKGRLAASQPVYDARLNSANAYGSAANTGMLQAIQQINAQRAAQGFTGSSTFDRTRLAQALIGGRQQAAGALAGAQLQNATDSAGLRIQDMNNRANGGLLAGGLQNAGIFAGMPLTQYSSAVQGAQSPLNFFKINPTSAPNTIMTPVSPEITAGQIWGSGISQAANSASGAFLSAGLSSKAGGSGGGGNMYAGSNGSSYGDMSAYMNNFYTKGPNG